MISKDDQHRVVGWPSYYGPLAAQIAAFMDELRTREGVANHRALRRRKRWHRFHFSGDAVALAQTLHFPHYRLVGSNFIRDDLGSSTGRATSTPNWDLNLETVIRIPKADEPAVHRVVIDCSISWPCRQEQLSCCPVCIAKTGTHMFSSAPAREPALATWPCQRCCSRWSKAM